MVRFPRNKKQTYRLNSRAQMWPSGLTLAMTLTLNFQGQIQNLLYLSHKWSDCHETKSKHIDWTLGLKCDHRVWLWPWPWIFKVKYRICCISAKIGQIASKRKANISIELQASNVTNGFELDLNLDLWILKVKCDLDLWPHRWPWPWIFKAKFWNSCISEWEGWLTLHKGGGSRSFMTMIMTIWWPRSGVWIYQVVTGVTSVVGVPSTHLVCFQLCHKFDTNAHPTNVYFQRISILTRTAVYFRQRFHTNISGLTDELPCSAGRPWTRIWRSWVLKGRHRVDKQYVDLRLSLTAQSQNVFRNYGRCNVIFGVRSVSPTILAGFI